MPEAKLVFDGDFTGVGDASESLLLLSGVDQFDTEQVQRVLHTAYQKLRLGGQIEFCVFDFGVALQIYRTDGLTERLMRSLSAGGHGRRSFWDELSITRTLFDVGFYKIWTGHLDERPPFELTVRALKSIAD